MISHQNITERKREKERKRKQERKQEKHENFFSKGFL